MTFPTQAALNPPDTPFEAPDRIGRSQPGWSAMPAEARWAVQLSLDERAWLARLGVAAIDAHSLPDINHVSSFFA